MSSHSTTKAADQRARKHSVSSLPDRGRPFSDLLTVDEAATALNTTPRFVRRLIAERRIVFHRIGRHVRIARRDLEAFVAAGRVEPESVEWTAGRAQA